MIDYRDFFCRGVKGETHTSSQVHKLQPYNIGKTVHIPNNSVHGLYMGTSSVSNMGRHNWAPMYNVSYLQSSGTWCGDDTISSFVVVYANLAVMIYIQA